jgi:hypothetical protein
VPLDGDEVFLQIPNDSYNPGETVEREADAEPIGPGEQK